MQGPPTRSSLVIVELSSNVRSILILNLTLNFPEIVPCYFPFRALGGVVDQKDIRAFSGGFSECPGKYEPLLS